MSSLQFLYIHLGNTLLLMNTDNHYCNNLLHHLADNIGHHHSIFPSLHLDSKTRYNNLHLLDRDSHHHNNQVHFRFLDNSYLHKQEDHHILNLQDRTLLEHNHHHHNKRNLADNTNLDNLDNHRRQDILL